MRVLIACEFSGIVREAFRKRGHDAWSLDLLPAEDGSKFHFYGYDLSLGALYAEMLQNGNHGQWDLLIGHPPCTRLCNSGVRWLYVNGRGIVIDARKWAEMESAVQFFRSLWHANVPRICLENPVMHGHAMRLMPELPTPQIIQPWQFGHGEVKATCLWLKGLKNLEPTTIVTGRTARVHREPPSPDRWKNRSRTLQGIADAMAEQWGS